MNPVSTPIALSSLAPESANRPGDDPIFALNAEAKRRAAQGEDVLNATLGALMGSDGKLAVLPSVAEAYDRVSRLRSSAYAPISGPPAFHEAVIRDLYGEGEMAARSIAVATAGGTGAIHHGVVNFLGHGQELLTSSYRWGPYDIIADHSGRRVRTFPMYLPEGGFDVDAFRFALLALVQEQGRALTVLNTPCHNPTGYSLDEQDWEGTVEAVFEAAERGPVTVLLDVAYAKFGPGKSAFWPRYAERMSERATVLVAWSASKAFAQYGARIGALVASHPDPAERARIQNALGYSCRGTWSNCNHAGMLAVTELLTDPELKARCDDERARLVELLGQRVAVFNEEARGAGLSFPRYEGGFFVSVFTPDARRTAASMQAEGVFVVPLDGAVRVALCSTPRTQIPRLVSALVRGVEAARRV